MNYSVRASIQEALAIGWTAIAAFSPSLWVQIGAGIMAGTSILSACFLSWLEVMAVRGARDGGA